MDKKQNHGIEKSGMIRTDYGKDSSDWVGSKAAERGTKMAGGVDNVSHSLSTSGTNKKG